MEGNTLEQNEMLHKIWELYIDFKELQFHGCVLPVLPA
jgi:hypothetical protein